MTTPHAPAAADRAAALVRPDIAALAGYVPGEQPQGGEWIKLNTNENPYAPSPEVAGAVTALFAGRTLAKYPDPVANRFREKAAEVLGVDPDWILCGNGSDDLLTILVRTFVGTGGALRVPTPSYILYRTLAGIQGVVCEEIPYERDWLLGPSSAPPPPPPAIRCVWRSSPIPTAPQAHSFLPTRSRRLPPGSPVRSSSTRPTAIFPMPTASTSSAEATG